MAPARRGLGKGLDTLIPGSSVTSKKNAAEQEPETVESRKSKPETMVNIALIRPNREQPRKNFDEDALIELSESIKQFGIIEPILVQDRQDHYEIIAGERRWRAAMKAGLKEIPAIIRNYSEQEIVEIALIENIQREDLTPIEEALAYKKLMDEFHMKHDQVAERVSKSRTAVTNSIRLLKLCKKVQEMVENGMITAGHARAIISVEDPDKQYELAQRIFDENLNVREVEKIIKKMNEPAKEGKPKPDTSQFDAIYENLAEKMKQTLGTKVSITSKGQGAGKIEIEFYSNEDLERIMELIH